MAHVGALVLIVTYFVPGASSFSRFAEPAASESRFGRKDYWNDSYKQKDSTFSWYSSWSDVKPLFLELVPDRESSILVPGIGNDDTAVGLFDSGYTRIRAFDYAPAAVERAREIFGPERLARGGDTLDLRVADCRELPYDSGCVDAVLEKGTLDSVFLSGGNDKLLAMDQLRLSVAELARTVRQGGLVISLSTPATEYIDEAFRKCLEGGAGEAASPSWRQVLNGDTFVTEEGFASIDINAVILAWERL